MHNFRFYLPILVGLTAAGCARQQQAYIIDPATGRPVPVAIQQQPVPPQYAQANYQSQAAASGERGLFNSRQSAPLTYAQQPQYVRPSAQPPMAAPSDGRGLFTSQENGPPAYLQQPAPPSYAMQYPAPQYVAPRTSFAAASLY
jgi:hypothetical protein